MSSNCSTPSATFFRHRSISPAREKYLLFIQELLLLVVFLYNTLNPPCSRGRAQQFLILKTGPLLHQACSENNKHIK